MPESLWWSLHRDLLMKVMETQPESLLMEQVKVRVQERLPHVSWQSIDDAVTRAYAQFAGCKVRTYLPILVEREAIDELRHGALSVVA